MRFQIECPDIGELIGIATPSNSVFWLDFLDDALVEKINAEAPFKLVPLNTPGRAAVPLPEHVEAAIIDYASIDAPVVPCADALGVHKRVKAVERELANGLSGAVAVHKAVRAYALPVDVAAELLHVPVPECEAVVSRGMWSGDEIGAGLDVRAREEVEFKKVQEARAAADKVRTVEMVTFKPSDYGLAVMLAEPVGMPVPWIFGDNINGFGVRGLTCRKYTFFPCPPCDWPEARFEGAIVLSSTATLTVKRSELPAKVAPKNWQLSIWSKLAKVRTDIDKSPMQAPFVDLRDARGQRAADAIRTYLKMHKTECEPLFQGVFGPSSDFRLYHLEHIARAYGSLSVDMLVSLLREAGWLRNGSGDHRASPEEARALLLNFQANGDMVSRGEYPEESKTDSDMYDAALAALLAGNEAPTPAEVAEAIKGAGLIDTNGHATGYALQRAGMVKKRSRANGNDSYRWVRS